MYLRAKEFYLQPDATLPTGSSYVENGDDAKSLPEKVKSPVSYFISPLKLSFLGIENYTYIVVDKITQQAAIVDPGWEYKKIVSMLDQLNIALTTILLTHSHPDHVYSVKPLQERYGSQVYMLSDEIDYYRFRCENLNALQHQDKVVVGDTSFTCLSTPGHTAGGACYLLSDDLFTGDTLFIEGCGVCTFHGADAEKMYASLQMIKKTIDQDVHIYPGHSFGKKPGLKLRTVTKENVYLWIEKKKQFIDWRMRSSSALI